MTIRRAFLLLVVPLFLLLAGVNGALVYFWERAEAERGLEGQAIAAAVTVAAFADTHDLANALADPVRAAGLRSAATHVTGLTALYLVDAEGRASPVVGAAPAGRSPYARPVAPAALPVAVDAAGRQHITGLAPVEGGRFVVAQIDAAPLIAEVAELRRLVAGLVVGAGLVGLVLALAIAQGIVRELAGSGALIQAIRTDAPVSEAEGFRIRETRDLALAVRLMRTSVAGRLARGRHELARRDRERDEAASAAAQHETAFPPLALEAAGGALAVRMLGRGSSGRFYAHCEADGRAGLVLGECAAETPATALAQALAARRYFEAHLLDGAPEACIAEGCSVFGVGRVAWRVWTATEPPAAGAPALLDGDNAARAEAYVARAAGLTPAQVLEDLVTLLEAEGVLAVVRSAEGGER
ncbi:hypothetical protein [Phenylobacterium sp.]|uniref:hypothetical protein n=1 Tax=Phenylobacterium sp. TaxID=1871053 RepID=UPI002EDAEFF9